MNYTKEQLLEAADIVDKAHDVLLREGWWPGTQRAGLGDTGRCMQAAVVEVVNPQYLCRQTTLMAGAVPHWLFILLDTHGFSFFWNDVLATEDMVFDRMRSVAKQFRDEAGAL